MACRVSEAKTPFAWTGWTISTPVTWAAPGEALGHGVGMIRIAPPQVIREQCDEPRGHEPHFGGQLHRLFADIASNLLGPGRKETTASAAIAPFLVPPNERTSTPAFGEDVEADAEICRGVREPGPVEME